MGTRNLTCVVKNGEYKVAQYGQFDGYPDGVGVDILNGLLKPNAINLLRKNVDNLKILTQEAINKEIIKEAGSLENYNKLDYGQKIEIRKLIDEKYPTPTREVAGNIIEMIVDGYNDYISLDVSFAADSLFCEWAYVIDLDKNTFEVYKGFNNIPLTENDRFFFLEKECKDNGYHPVIKIAEFDLNNLPLTSEDFCNQIPSEDEDDENVDKNVEEIKIIINKNNTKSNYMCTSINSLKTIQKNAIEEAMNEKCKISIEYNDKIIFLIDYTDTNNFK